MSSSTTRRLLILALVSVFALPLSAADFPLPVFLPEVLVYPAAEIMPLPPFITLAGCTATRNLVTNEVTITRGQRTFTCTPLSREALVNGTPVTLAQAPYEQRQAVYMPLRPLVEALGGTMSKAPTGDTITLRFPDMATPLVLPARTMTGKPAALLDDDAELYTMNLDGSDLQRVTYNTDDDELPAFSADGHTWITSYGGGLYLRKANSAESICLQPPTPPSGEKIMCCTSLVLSPDGKQVFYLKQAYQPIRAPRSRPDSSEVSRVRLDGTEPPALVAASITAFNLTPDGSMVVGTISDRAGPRSVTLIRPGSRPQMVPGNAFGFSPDGARLLISRSQQNARLETISLKDPDAGVTTSIPLEHGLNSCIVFAPDGTFFVSNIGNDLCAVTADRGSIRKITSGALTPLSAARFSVDGTRLFALDISSGTVITVNVDGTGYRKLTNRISVRQFTLLPDGKHILFVAAPVIQP